MLMRKSGIFTYMSHLSIHAFILFWIISIKYFTDIPSTFPFCLRGLCLHRTNTVLPIVYFIYFCKLFLMYYDTIYISHPLDYYRNLMLWILIYSTMMLLFWHLKLFNHDTILHLCVIFLVHDDVICITNIFGFPPNLILVISRLGISYLSRSYW